MLNSTDALGYAKLVARAANLDKNGDGKIDLTDVTYLAQHLVGWYD